MGHCTKNLDGEVQKTLKSASKAYMHFCYVFKSRIKNSGEGIRPWVHFFLVRTEVWSDKESQKSQERDQSMFPTKFGRNVLKDVRIKRIQDPFLFIPEVILDIDPRGATTTSASDFLSFVEI